MQLFPNKTPHNGPSGHERRQHATAAAENRTGPLNSALLDEFIGDSQIMAEAERLLSERTRNIRLRGNIATAFRRRTLRYAASVIRSWMIWVVLLDLFMLALNFLLLPRETALAVIAPASAIAPAALGVAILWRKPRPQWILDWSLIVGMWVVLLAICFMGVAAGSALLERYLHIMLFVAIAGIVIFSVPFAQTVAIAVSAMTFYLVFQLGFAETDIGVVMSGFFFFASGVGATVLARRTMNILAYKSFLLELQDRQHLATLARANRRLERLSKIDGLTGAANRHLLRERIEEMWQGKGPVALLMCDIDDFKALNDCLGHLEGDKCLVEVARLISSCTRTDIDCVARYGGEEFLVLLPGMDEAEALSVAERIRTNVAAAGLSNPGSRVKPTVTLSIGVAVGRTQAELHSSELIKKRADAALYFAKRAGRNQVRLWNRGMDARGKISSAA